MMVQKCCLTLGWDTIGWDNISPDVQSLGIDLSPVGETINPYTTYSVCAFQFLWLFSNGKVLVANKHFINSWKW